ncbi:MULTISPECIES: FMN-binding negative transcriptional regulator [Staphylococcus]|uniref:FMN-binding negative transcriptional regulator n=1 Tax=Staphylococcus TaxID=1279 RepID=UPI0002463AA8|nr:MULTISPECIES: FMN-binding negative transcriptional regulator [Staphylococcus]QAV30787.1 protease [Sulfitobacter donghicola]AGZ25644.1 putative transcriptional regulator [Staphylococcus pasteuri SP1]KAB7644715.1 FMN-binding negative transcriptional regulator [Staphylococcus sp. B2-b]MBN6853233.1 FMN-binding negative transcriptional regulator [Staphylococcus warneri]MBT2769991.1 FMN-binding negative transcriptional regulator [Staphylococcus warneri]
MYIGKHSQIDDYEEIKQFIQHNNFATVVTNNGTKPIASHIPVMISEQDNHLVITGHLAKNNNLIQTIEHNPHVLIIFQGPDAYISSTWYEAEDVPTWDYQSVHVYGDGRLLNHEELVSDLKQLLNHYEGHKEEGATWNHLSEGTKKQIKGIVGFQVKVNDIEAAYKLSQNRSAQEKVNIAKQLKASGNQKASKLAEEIEKY